MQNIFTFYDLLRYAYKEIEDEAFVNLNSQISCSAKLEWKSFLDIYSKLDKLQDSPSDNAVQNILKYSKSLASCNSNKGRQAYFVN